jgi:uncharacterized protein YbbC (DUF1343 family)
MDVGLDRLPELPGLVSRLASSRVGLLAHPASVDRGLRHVSDVLAALHVTPTRLFGPEHGYGGEAQDMIGVASARDARTGAPIKSLYGERYEELSPTADDLDAIDVLLIDLADVGARYYTFVWTALLAVRAAAARGVHTMILDRPNPLGGAASTVEGGLVRQGFSSFVGLEPIPVRHSLTVGEIVALFAERDGLRLGADGAVSVVETTGWSRAEDARAWDRPFVMTSPNMPTFDTVRVYPGGCLLEGTNLSEGRGTTRPFELFGAPWLDGRRLAEALAKTRLPGFVARPITFLPMFQKHGGSVCGGVQLHVVDERFRSYPTYLAAIALCRRHHPEDFRFRTERYEFVDDIPAFDLLTGSAQAREAMIADEDPEEIARVVTEVEAGWTAVAEQARRAAAACAVAT